MIAADNGHINSLNNVVKLCERTPELLSNDDQITHIKKYYLLADKAQNQIAQYRLGLWSYVKKQYKEAIQFFTRASANQHIHANYYLAEMYFKGISVPQDYVLSFQYLKKCAFDRAPASLYLYGYFHYYGICTTKNYYVAFANMLLSANQGYEKAYSLLAIMYLLGKGTERSVSDAELYFAKAKIK